jgi:biotin/methionine sulfoxide reductase
MITTLASMLGHIGVPGAGIGYGYGCIHNFGFGGRRVPNYRMGALGQEIGERTAPANHFIPVARHADMLNNPGTQFDYNGQALTYPDIKLIYWAGGNPFHHHQDLNTLRRAWQKPETIIVNESFWTASARHADIVFPCKTTLERNDIGGSSYDGFLSPMRQAAVTTVFYRRCARWCLGSANRAVTSRYSLASLPGWALRRRSLRAVRRCSG